eukprot:GEMP01028625.1.p1 GENE.GEMP01028625.1~~GEMP01028625.1.p1  ORF type:complete len:325 (+),score=88.53 GEMP01028625.1:209-1183(+)
MTKPVLACVRETRNGEARVALTPAVVQSLATSWKIRVESGCGVLAGFADDAYRSAGAEVTGFAHLFDGVDVLVRVKRAEREREVREPAVPLMIGFLDPLDTVTSHVAEWREKRMTCVSLDCLRLPRGHTGDPLVPMSELAGELAVDDAITRAPEGHVVCVGSGTSGLAAAKRARDQYNRRTIVVGRTVEKFSSWGGECMTLENLHEALNGAAIVIATARTPGQVAPKLITEDELRLLAPKAVVVDLARTQGGNVVGSVNDGVVELCGRFIVNVTGYPKREPQKASERFGAALEVLLTDLQRSKMSVVDSELRYGVFLPDDNVRL